MQTMLLSRPSTHHHTDANTILGMYQTGELSLYNVPNDQLAQYAGDPTLVTNKLLRNTFIEFNPANEFLGNINIREAFSIAFNRQIFAEQVMGDASLAALRPCALRRPRPCRRRPP